ncbi:MAG: endopeptidase La [Armatimonadetes bacterium]|nr:endopeptidase La [Armatimonadota bacterium]
MAKAPPRRRSALAGTHRVPVLPVRDNVYFPELVSTLLVGREMSLRALEHSATHERLVLVLGQRDSAVDEPAAADLYRIGTLSEVLQVVPMPDGTLRMVMKGLSRCRVSELRFRSGYFSCTIEPVAETAGSNGNVEALRREALEGVQQLSSLGKGLVPEVVEALSSIEHPSLLADSIMNHMPVRPDLKQEVLEELDPIKRLEKVIKLLVGERQVLELQVDLRHRVEKELGNTQREYYLREQLRAIQDELNGPETYSPEGEELRLKIEGAKMPPEVMEKALGELRRLERAHSSSPESMVIRTYIEWLVALPWSHTSEDRLDVRQASGILEEGHFGLAKVKERILDFLAVRQLSNSLRGPVLCFVGPPGVGKTSLGRSIADALGRKFVRVSLGGVRDEAEIRGHRRTYIGSMPGRIIQGIKQCGTKNPVLMLDEVDKMSADFRGDPTSSLLEVLDPEQNRAFSDHYIEASFDLSAVMFIVTANLIENIPGPLRDRMEVISFPSYTEEEKVHIGCEYLLPKAIQEHGLQPDRFTIEPDALREVIRNYTREAGVRNLEREIATVCRKSARRVAEGFTGPTRVTQASLQQMLGIPKFQRSSEADNGIGVCTGLAYTEMGGETLTIEVSLMPALGEEPKLTLTGSLGTVMKESALAALTYLRANQDLFPNQAPFRSDVHVHIPEGAVPKDGPSAGVAMVVALASAYSQVAIPLGIAMTGEITLQGRVLAVGGIREKVMAAHRSGIREIILPEENSSHLDELPKEVTSKIEFHLVSHVRQVLELVLRVKSS